MSDRSGRDGFVQGPPDIGGGKRIANIVVTLPAGSAVTNADGSTTALTTDTQVYIQRVTLADSKGFPMDSLTDQDRQEEILQELKKIRRGIVKICGESFLEED